MDYMKKFGFLLTAAAALAATSCVDDSDGDFPYSNPLITTVRTLDGDDYYFQRDNGETLYASDKTRVKGYKAEDRQRAIIWFSLLEGIQGYDYNLRLYAVDNIYTGTSEIVEDAARLEELGNNPTSITPGYCNLTKEWMTLYVGYPVTDNAKHSFTLIVNRVEAPEESHPDYLDVELRHGAGGDLQGYTRGYYVSFDLTPIAAELEGCKGVTLRILTQENGTKYFKFDLPQEK